MTAHASKLDIEKFRKVYALISKGATEGERAAAKARAEVIAARGGITFKQAVSMLDGKQAEPQRSSFFEDLFNDPTFRAERDEREREKAIKRAELIGEYGSEDAVWAETPMEALLSRAVEHLKEWKVSDCTATGETYRYVFSLAGMRDFYRADKMPSEVRGAVMGAYPFPIALREVLEEYRAWDRLYLDRNTFNDFEHWHWVEARVSLLRLALETQPVRDWDDMAARMDWWQIVLDWQSHNPIAYDQAFKDRVSADLAILRSASATNPISSGQSSQDAGNPTSSGWQKGAVSENDTPNTIERDGVQHGQSPTSRRRAEVLSILDAAPDLSDREIARRVGVSPQTVNNWRRRRAAQPKRMAA